MVPINVSANPEGTFRMLQMQPAVSRLIYYSGRICKTRARSDAQIFEWTANGLTMSRVNQDEFSKVSEIILSQVTTGQLNLVVMDELTDISRKPRELWRVIQTCIDSGCRLIATLDGIDTARRTWEIEVHLAIIRHEQTQSVVRRRTTKPRT